MKVFIAATLKPVNDPRLYEKIGKTLAEKGGYSVVISGYDAKLPISAAKKVKFYPLFKFKRLSLERVWAPLKIIPLVLKEKPDVLIVASHELLSLAVLLKIVSKVKIVYDIQENYLYNILYQQTFSSILRPVIGFYVRSKELITSKIFDGFILAERVYQEQLNFLGDKFLILENKFKSPTPEYIVPQKESGLNQFLYTGTIGEDYGIFEAIAFIEAYHSFMPEARLKILGYAPASDVKEKLDKLLIGKDYIDAEIREGPVPYTEIYHLLIKGGVLLLPYKTSRAINGRIPTRFYEGKALGIPMIINNGLELKSALRSQDKSLYLDFMNPDVNAVNSWLQNIKAMGISPDNEALWESQEGDLVKWIASFASA